MSDEEKRELEAIRNQLQTTAWCIHTTLEGMKWNPVLGLNTLEGRFDNLPSAHTTLDTALLWLNDLLARKP